MSMSLKRTKRNHKSEALSALADVAADDPTSCPSTASFFPHLPCTITPWKPKNRQICCTTRIAADAFLEWRCDREVSSRRPPTSAFISGVEVRQGNARKDKVRRELARKVALDRLSTSPLHIPIPISISISISLSNSRPKQKDTIKSQKCPPLKTKKTNVPTSS